MKIESLKRELLVTHCSPSREWYQQAVLTRSRVDRADHVSGMFHLMNKVMLKA